MEVVACNLCGSTHYTGVYEMPDRRYFPDEFFTVVECNECGLGFVNPRPTFEEIQKYYPPEYYAVECSGNRKENLRRYAVEATYLREIERRGGPKKLLDLGCANGEFPRFMKARGWTVEGVEVSPSTEPIRDFKVYTQPFPKNPINQSAYDAVTAWAVFEHLHDPMAYFRKASQVIRRGGLFVFLVPNFNSLASRHLFCEDVPRHLYFFTEKTVRQFLAASGFKLEKAHYRKNIFSMPPANWLIFLIKTRVKKETFSYRDVPLTRPEFLKRNQLQPGLLSTLRFAMDSPFKAMDRALWPFIEIMQILRKSYGVTTYIARKL